MSLAFNQKLFKLMKKTFSPFNYLVTVMKITIIPFLVSLLFTSLSLAGGSYGQDMLSKPVHIKAEKQELREVLHTIERSSQVKFSFVRTLVNGHKVTINVANQPLEFVLQQILAPLNITYSVSGQYIILNKKQELRGQPQTSAHQELLPAEINIKGRVTASENKEGLPGVSVLVKSTTQGTVTDADGNFEINVPDQQSVLVFSFVGYLPHEVTVGNSSQLDITLQADIKALSEVVVVGYGTQKKVNMTGSVASIDFSNVAQTRPISSLSSGLAGLSAGISVKQNSGQPGSDGATLRIRGQGTLNNSDPLVIIDGVQGNMNDVNPQDVANISILKDAASAAIYGSRAANGVILITTKRGSKDKTTLSYNVRFSQQKPSNLINMVTDYPRHMELINEGFNNSSPGTGPFSQATIDDWRTNSAIDPVKYPNTNWFDWILQKKWAQEHNVSASGGSEKSTYLLSFNYLDSPGLVENGGFKRYNARINVESQVNKWLTVGTNTFGLWSNSGLANIDDLFSFTGATVPGITPRDPQGRYGSAMAPGENQQANNYLWTLNSTRGDIERQKIFSRFYSNIRFTKSLTLESGFSIDYDNQTRRSIGVYIPRYNFQTEQIWNPNPSTYSVGNTNARAYQTVLNHVLKYNNTFGKHQVSALLGYQEESYKRNNFSASKSDPIDDATPVLDATSTNPVVGGNATDWALRSFFGRVNYNFSEKYLLEANLRYDGSSRFASNKRWGLFPSLSAGWRLSEEEFLKDVSFINELKLRGSWGSLGNNSIGNYDYQSVYGTSNYSFNGIIVQGGAPAAIANSALTWEKTNITNIGVDFATFKNRLGFEAEWFNKNTSNILIDLPIPLVNGNLTAPKQNAAMVLNRGVELTLNWRDKAGDVNYGISGNFSYIKNKVTRFKGSESSLFNQNIMLEGHPIWSFYVREVDRIVKDSDMEMINQMIADGYTFNPGIPKPGDFLYKDLNGDKRINDDDRKIVDANVNPKVVFGLNLNADWKGLSFSTLIQGSAGNKAYWRDLYMSTGMRNGYQINQAVADDHWAPDNQDARYPRLTNYTYAQNTTPNSDFWLQDASYVRLKNVQLGYTVPVSLTRKFFVQRLFVYVNAENLITLTPYEGIDPEITTLGTTLGTTQTMYPTMKQLSFGVNVSF
jgi:TonB-linked SusC/RagA family outer membrane protein